MLYVCQRYICAGSLLQNFEVEDGLSGL